MSTATMTSDRPTTAKLIVPREEALSHLRAMLERGGEIKAARIRSGDDLDEARGHKLEWTQDVIDLLNNLFDNSSVADFCNDWVGKIFPEYAEFGNFVEQFYEEMDYRLGKLRTVLKRVEQAADAVSPSPSPAPAQDAPEPSAAPGPSESVMPAAASSPANFKVLFVTHGPRDASAEAVLQFMQQLSLPVVEADHTNGLIDTLEARNDAGFVIVMHGPSDAGANGHLSDSSMFKLGYCAGRVGMKRMCMMHAPTQGAPGEGHGLPHVPVDANGGWQLHLARQMKRAGLDIDLNRLA